MEVDQLITLWYPEKVWMHRSAEGPKGRLLAKGETADVLEELRQDVPADLLAELRNHYGAVGETPN